MKTTLQHSYTEAIKNCFLLATVVLAAQLAPCLVAASEADFDHATQTLRVGVWIENLEEGDVLEKGEEFAVGFQTNEDAYAVVYRINTEGLVTILWPRSRMDDGFVFGGHEYLMPVSGSRRLVASSQTGEGFVETIVSSYPFDLRELPLDFHHEYAEDKFNFLVSGDPFLAINEVNFAITGLENSDDFVVSNYLSYYVHQKVEHPRYLCNQCHMDDEIVVNPYRDQCTIEVTVDYGWGNDWYDTYGYYPIYHNPVFVYYDPWTWRPWVNFWYDPYYTCSSRPGYHYNHSVYAWCDSPYYHYDRSNHAARRGLRQGHEAIRDELGGRRKTREYSSLSGLIAKSGPSENEREAMRQKRTIETDVRAGISGRDPERSRTSHDARNVKPIVRTRPSIDVKGDRGSRGGLQIRKAGQRSRTTLDGSPGSRERQVNTIPVRGGSSGGAGTVRSGRVEPVRGRGDNSGSNTPTVLGNSRLNPESSKGVKPTRGKSGDGRIKPVEPRKQGTRIWNSRSGSQSEDRKVRNPSRGTSGDRGSSNSSVKPRSEREDSGSSRSVEPKSSQRKSSGSSGVKSSSGSSSRSSKSSSSNSGSSRSSSSKSSSSKSGRESGSSRSKR